jgi:2-methylcitrate dehydratase PrpD
LTAGLGEVWETPGITYKIYPCCMLNQSAMYAVRSLQAEHQLLADDVERIDCFVPPESYRVLCEPREVKINPRSDFDTFFSLPFALAVALLDKEITLGCFSEERRSDRRTLDLAQRVSCARDERMDVAQFQPARVVLVTHDGRTFERFQICHGSPGDPMEQAEIEHKFHNNVEGILAPRRASEAIGLLLRLQDLEDVRELMTLCVPRTGGGQND